ncbi:DUF423 domain-containing protein [Colwellia asteriadis]|uniref:DUF423 domain-containing protein n=2 Tax=Colwelliaceae TaxID=267889 RepID=A0ABP3WFL3_9GAMM
MIFVGISGCFSVLFGAWLAHGGQSLASNVQSSLSTALQYQLFHTITLLVCLVWAKIKPPSKPVIIACICFLLGILCFSCTIYIKLIFEVPLLGKLTPIGGMSFALAWLMLALEGKNNL